MRYAMLGSGELIVILCVVMLLFGGKKLPEFARGLGRGIREFKKAAQGIEDEINPDSVIDKKSTTTPISTSTSTDTSSTDKTT
jgi:sec-independent protein translocase protein TatA